MPRFRVCAATLDPGASRLGSWKIFDFDVSAAYRWLERGIVLRVHGWEPHDRGAEVVDLLAALNTGHEGGCSTVHANSVADVPARLEALAVPAGMSRDAVHAQVLAGLRVVLHLHRLGGRHRLAQLGVLTRAAGGVVCQPALRVDAGRLVTGPAAAELERLLYAVSP